MNAQQLMALAQMQRAQSEEYLAALRAKKEADSLDYETRMAVLRDRHREQRLRAKEADDYKQPYRPRKRHWYEDNPDLEIHLC